MSRLFFIFLIVGGIYWLLRGRIVLKRPSAKPMPKKLVRCVHCKVYLPEAEAIYLGEQIFCSEQHRLDHLAP